MKDGFPKFYFVFALLIVLQLHWLRQEEERPTLRSERSILMVGCQPDKWARALGLNIHVSLAESGGFIRSECLAFAREREVFLSVHLQGTNKASSNTDDDERMI